MKWKSHYCCHVQIIDDQHKRLFEITSKLQILEPISHKIDCIDEIIEILNELKSYTVYHFKYEEEILAKAKYEFYEQHCLEHTTIINKLQDLKNEVEQNRDPRLIHKLIELSTFWISNHILDVDKEYSQYLNNKGFY